ncbi:sulfur carrier protein [Hyphomicrobium sp. 1Nfss2.1]|uniref:sulfur carrier protein ThiS n=1 Tax=Hyphomicrobium sp. 1Nfss2.1 TaxID=3413936 RepID=UPI003C7B68E7
MSETLSVAGERRVIVNGEEVVTSAATLDALVAERGLEGTPVATARNGDFVPARVRAETPLQAGDHIEIVSPRHGG